ncbi:hypothetical protein Goshw_006006 [Gossypium schwendimanii]|uniref:Zinc knuckle CX2CX4HX4C domain-containing protein n=1 Tax=Gossypium schwendimanii TaxID=34291 RepID=A0A7J9MGA0_GOSSC|nr:hypothetical protein [Gossypium schwendimanii]
MRIRIRLDMKILLKRKKNIQFGKDRIVYARFQLEKLSLFCFICGKLSHGESFFSFWTRIEPSKLVFGWDISLRAVKKTLKAGFQGKRDIARNNKGDMEKSNLNPNFIPLGFRQKILTKGIDNWRNMDSKELNRADSDNGPMDLVLTEENDPLLSIEGKKRQFVVNDRKISSGNNIERGLHDITASSTGQSNRMQ